MSVGSVFRLTALLAFGAGAAWMLATESILALLGAEPDAVLVFVARQQAALLLAGGLLLWVARESGASPARRAILVGGFWAGLFVAFIWLDAVLGGVIPSGGLLAVAAGIILAIAFAGAGARSARAGSSPPGDGAAERSARRERSGGPRGRRRGSRGERGERRSEPPGTA